MQWILRPHNDGVGHDGRNVLEHGGESHVFRDGNAAGIVGVAIVPAVEYNVFVRCCTNLDSCAFWIGATARHSAQFGVVSQYGDGVLGCALLMEQRFIAGILCDGDVTWVAGDAVAPTDENVILVGCSRQCGGAAVIVYTRTGHRTAFHWVAFGGDFVLEEPEHGGVGGVAFHEDGSRIGDDSIIPFAEHIAWIAVCGQVDGLAIIVRAASYDGACVLRIHFSGDDALPYLEMCGVGLVFGDNDGSWVGHVTIGPAIKGEA